MKIINKIVFFKNPTHRAELKSNSIGNACKQAEIKDCGRANKRSGGISKRHKILRLLLVLGVFAVLAYGIFLILKHFELLEKLKNVDDIKEMILKGGALSYLIFFVLQFLQVTFVPIPSIITTIAGTLVFGPILAFVYSTCAILLGSYLAFFLGRRYGVKLLHFVAGEKVERLRDKLTKCKYIFCVALLFPFAPDDMLCLIAGTTKMSNKFFLTTILICRPISIFFACFFGGGAIIPFKGLWLIVWGVIIIAMIILFYLSVKYQDKLEDIITKIALKFKRKRKADCVCDNTQLPLPHKAVGLKNTKLKKRIKPNT